MIRECAVAGCERIGDHLVIEVSPMAMLFESGAGLVCDKHAYELDQIGGDNLGLVRELIEPVWKR